MTATQTVDPVTRPLPYRDSASRNTHPTNSFVGPKSAPIDRLLEGAQAVFFQRMSGSASVITVRHWNELQTETRTAPAIIPAAVANLIDLAAGRVAQRFSEIAQAICVYADVIQNGLVFSVFVKGDHYDDAVMDRLLDAELALHKQLGDFRTTFNYLPYVAGSNPQHMVRETARCILERRYG